MKEHIGTSLLKSMSSYKRIVSINLKRIEGSWLSLQILI